VKAWRDVAAWLEKHVRLGGVSGVARPTSACLKPQYRRRENLNAMAAAGNNGWRNEMSAASSAIIRK